MNDLIYRQAAIDALGEEPPVWYDSEDEIAERNQWRRDVNAIKAVPPAQQWIPCSERMPEQGDEVLTTYIVNGNRKRHYVGTATWYEGDDGCWSSPWDEYRVPGTRTEVIAWMSLPEPWKGGQHETEQ